MVSFILNSYTATGCFKIILTKSGLTKLLHKLENRSKKKENGTGRFSSKTRIPVSPAKCSPSDTPNWARKADIAASEGSQATQQSTPSGAGVRTADSRRQVSFRDALLHL